MMMFPYENSPTPLSAAEFYALLAFAGEDLHKYDLKARIYTNSLGSLPLVYIQINRIIDKFLEEIFIEPARTQASARNGKPIQVYTITHYGRARLEQDTQRLTFALKIADRLGINQDFGNQPTQVLKSGSNTT